MMITVKMSLWEKILGWVMIAAHLFFLGIIVEIFFMYMGWETETLEGAAELNIAYFLLGFVITGAIFARFLIRNLKTFRRSVKKSFLAVLAGGAALMILNLAVNTATETLFPEFYNMNDASLDEMGTISNAHSVLMLICTAFLVPITEECLYRGVLFQTLYHRNRLVGFILSTLVFAAIHVIGYEDQGIVYMIVAFHQYLPAGIALGLAYEMSDSIWAPIILHSINNFIASI